MLTNNLTESIQFILLNRTSLLFLFIRMAAKSSLMSSPCSACEEQYDVFLSFRGEDTRYNFTSHLHAALCQKNIATFLDDQQIERGNELSSTLLGAIERSRISIVIFSEKYAFSRWCLDELVKIIECKNILMPVFYHIDPTHVRNQSGPYENAFSMHERDNPVKVLKWRAALNKAANSAGWDSSSIRLESKLVESIVEDVLQKLNRNVIPEVPIWLVGINNHIAKLKPLLCIGSPDVRTIGIWGLGGIGKTTIAEVLFHILQFDFQRCCFIQNVREKWQNNKQELRNELLNEILGDQLHISTPNISAFVVDRLQCNRVLIVLDDVSNADQIEYLVGENGWFGLGSRIIVTTRNKDVLGINDKLYEVKLLNTEEGLRLFSSKAFPEDHPKIEFIGLSNEIVAYAGGIPLVLKVLGSFLRSKSLKEWKSAWQKLKKVPNKQIHQVLSLSYEELDSDDQNIFLDIACFLKGQTKCQIINILDGCDFFTDIGLRNLEDKSLITISKHDTVEMHDLIQEMGWNIVRQESSNELEKQSRLWDPEEIYLLLNGKKGTNCSVESISLNTSQINNVEISPNTFARMSKLRLLKFCVHWRHSSNVHVSEAGLESLPDALRYFCWDRFPLKALPSSFCGEMLVELELRNSRIEKLWDAEPELANLKSLCLANSKYLIELSNLSKAKNLEEINLDCCTSLQKVSSSIFSLPHLLAVNLSYCKKLMTVRSDMVSRSLRWLNLCACLNLAVFSVRSEKLEYLNFRCTAINSLPTSIQEAKNLSFLSVNSKWLEQVPPILETSWSMSMTTLKLDHCSNLSELPESLGLLAALNKLFLRTSNIVTLPESIKLLSKLKTLNVMKCKKLRSLPEFPVMLRHLYASGCTSLETVASSEAAKLIKNSFGSQNRSFLLRHIQELKISPCHQLYWENFDFLGCTKLNENAIETIVAEAIMRIKHAICLLSIDDDPYNQFHLTSKDFDAGNFEDTCRRLHIAQSDNFPSWGSIRAVESSALTIKINANCCEKCKASRFAFGLFESENSDFGFDGRHRVCRQQMNWCARLKYYKLWYTDVRFSFHGSRVPDFFRYRTTETTQITIALPSHSNVLGFAFCLVLSHYPSDKVSYRPFVSLESESYVTCECYSGFRSQESRYSYDKKYFPDTVFLWYDTNASNWILEESKSNCSFDFRFSVFSRWEMCKKTNLIKECGVWPIYASDLESVDLRVQQDELRPRKKSKRSQDIDDLGEAGTSEIEKQDEL